MTLHPIAALRLEVARLHKIEAAIVTLLSGDVGRQTLAKLTQGQGTDTEDGRAWMAAAEIVKQNYQCEDCIGMKDYGCYCKSVGAIQPGGPIITLQPEYLRAEHTEENVEISRLRNIEAAAVAAIDFDQWQGDEWYESMMALQKALCATTERSDEYDCD